MNRLRKIFATLVLAVFPGASVSSDLLEFSTSMDFDEFEVVVEHLRRTDAMFAEEIARAIAEFKAAGKVGATWRREFANGRGHMTLEKEDDYALTIAVFTDSPLHEKLDAAYQSAAAELGI
jgi:hypothetical protein